MEHPDTRKTAVSTTTITRRSVLGSLVTACLAPANAGAADTPTAGEPVDDDEAPPCRAALEESLDAIDLLEYLRARPNPRFPVEALRDDDDHGCPLWGLHVEVAGALVRIDPGPWGRPELTISADLVTAVDPCSLDKVMATPVARQLLDRGWETAISDDDFGGMILFWRSVRRSQFDEELAFIERIVRNHDVRVEEALRALGRA